MVQTTRRTQRQRRAETEQRLLDAALELIAAHGSRPLTLAQVAERAGYSRGIVTHQFGTRDTMLRRVAAYAQEKFAVAATDSRGLERLRQVVDLYLTNMAGQEPAGRALLLMWAEAAASETALQQPFAAGEDRLRSVLADRIAEGIDEGTIRADADPAATAVMLTGLLRGVALQLLNDPDLTTLDKLRGEFSGLIQRWLVRP